MTPNNADVTAALITAVVSGIEQAQASLAVWDDKAAHRVANEKAAEAIELVRHGQFDSALENLRTAAEWKKNILTVGVIVMSLLPMPLRPVGVRGSRKKAWVQP